jgi:protease-4
MIKRVPVRRLLGGMWGLLTRVRLALANLLFLFVLVVLFLAWRESAPPPLPAQAVLVLDPVGSVVDQTQFQDPLWLLIGGGSGLVEEVALRDLVESVDYAAEDKGIRALVLDLNGLLGIGLSRSQELAEAIDRFRAAGKPVLAHAEYYGQQQYWLAAQADEVLLHPLGVVGLEGFGNYQNYFAEALEKLSVTMHIFRAGEFKSASEIFDRREMSPGERSVSQAWLDDLWAQFTASIEQRRGLSPGALTAWINRYDEVMLASGGDAARAALDGGLVDRLLPRQGVDDYLATRFGDAEGHYDSVSYAEYLPYKRPRRPPPSESIVAVVAAQGEILMGEQPPGMIGGDSLAATLRDVAEMPGVKAIVLRISSGGGSMFASELIREAVRDVRAAGTPVIASFGNVAASGGYYIAMDADEIWATPGTLTGSIGVFMAFPTVEDVLSKLGIQTDGVGTTELAGSLRLDRPLNPKIASGLQSAVDHSYRWFVDGVAEGRGLTPQQVAPYAEGRVFAASTARAAGLVDELGSLKDAVAAAAARAGLSDYAIRHVGPALSPRDLLLQRLAGLQASAWLPVAWQTLLSQWAGLEVLQRGLRLDDPRGLYVRCTSCPAP